MTKMLDMHMHAMQGGVMKLETYLRKKKMTDEAFAVLVGLSQSQISRIRRGKSSPSWGAVERIIAATNGKVTANDLMHGRKALEAAE